MRAEAETLTWLAVIAGFTAYMAYVTAEAGARVVACWNAPDGAAACLERP